MKGGHGTVLIIYLPLSWWPWQIPLSSWWPWQIPLIKQLLSMFPYCKLSFVKKGPCLMCIWWQKADKMQAVFFFFFYMTRGRVTRELQTTYGTLKSCMRLASRCLAAPDIQEQPQRKRQELWIHATKVAHTIKHGWIHSTKPKHHIGSIFKNLFFSYHNIAIPMPTLRWQVNDAFGIQLTFSCNGCLVG